MIKLITAIASGLIVVALAGCKDTVESTYPSIESARAAGAISRGWIPSILPLSASNIRERHNIDTNETWGTFAFLPEEWPKLAAALTELPSSELQRLHIRAPANRWWPAVLNAPLDQRAVQNSGLTLYRSAGTGSFLFAIDSNKRQGFFWTQ